MSQRTGHCNWPKARRLRRTSKWVVEDLEFLRYGRLLYSREGLLGIPRFCRLVGLYTGLDPVWGFELGTRGLLRTKYQLQCALNDFSIHLGLGLCTMRHDTFICPTSETLQILLRKTASV